MLQIQAIHIILILSVVYSFRTPITHVQRAVGQQSFLKGLKRYAANNNKVGGIYEFSGMDIRGRENSYRYIANIFDIYIRIYQYVYACLYINVTTCMRG